MNLLLKGFALQLYHKMQSIHYLLTLSFYLIILSILSLRWFQDQVHFYSQYFGQ